MLLLPTSSLAAPSSICMRNAVLLQRHAIIFKSPGSCCGEVGCGAMRAVPTGFEDASKGYCITQEKVQLMAITNMSACKGSALVAQLKVCAQHKDLCTGSKIHAHIVESRLLESNIFLGSGLINMYAKCGALTKAHHVFNELPIRNIFCWTALITGYSHHGFGKEALACFHQMKCEGLSPDAITFACILKACGGLRSLQKGQIIHADIIREGLLGTNTTLDNALLDMYAKCGLLAKAHQLFNEFPDRDVVSWNALIAGYCEHAHNEKALSCYEQMKLIGLLPNSVTFLCALKACASTKAVEKGREIHEEIANKGFFGKDSLLCTALVDMYAKCGLLSKAQKVFDEISVPDIVSWNTLITGYCRHGLGEEAWKCYDNMRQKELSPDAITYACILKACGNIGAIAKGEQIHEEIHQKGLLREDSVLATSLVDMYVKCGALTKAQKVFDQISIQDVVSWNALIAGYCQHGHGDEAFDCFERMRCKGLSPNIMTFSSLLKVCGSTGATERGIELHAEITRSGLQGHVSELGNALVNMYAKSGALIKAQEVFDKLTVHDAVSWTTLIAGYCEHGHGEEALTCFEQMLEKGLSPDAVTFACIFKACESLGAVEKGHEYFDLMITRYGIIPTSEHYVYMVELLGGAGRFDQAVGVINKMPSSGCFEVWYALLGACQKWGNVKLGQFAFENASRLNDKSAAVYVCMSKLYAVAGMHEDADKMLVKAKEVFDSLPFPDAVSWNSLISGYCDRGLGEEALNCFQQLKKEGICPNALTFLSILKACGSIGAADKGQEIHEEITSRGLLEKDSVLGAALVDMYCKCGALAKAKEVFDKLIDRNAISWNALIACYCEHGLAEEALQCFDLMQCEGLFPDTVTITCILKACGNLGLSIKGQEIHDKIICQWLLKMDDGIGSALVDMYTKCGEVVKAQEVSDGLLVRDIVSWNALISGYCEHGHGEEACVSYEQMKKEGVPPNEKTYTSILQACGSVGAVEKGAEIHAEISRGGLLEQEFTVLGSALVDMYVKCGSLVKAQEVLNTLRARDIFSWTALISGYCQHGLCEKALNCFEQMKYEGCSPDAVTFACILRVCSSLGAADTGQMYYDLMSASYGITPSIQHDVSFVKLLGYVGHFDKVMALIKKIPSSDCNSAWFSLLGTCQTVGNAKYGHLAFKHAI